MVSPSAISITLPVKVFVAEWAEAEMKNERSAKKSEILDIVTPLADG